MQYYDAHKKQDDKGQHQRQSPRELRPMQEATECGITSAWVKVQIFKNPELSKL